MRVEEENVRVCCDHQADDQPKSYAMQILIACIELHALPVCCGGNIRSHPLTATQSPN